MGQRLVISIYKDNKESQEPIMAIYYHWSGYTTSALYEAREIINNYKKYEAANKEDYFKNLILALEDAGARIEPCELEYAIKTHPEIDFKTDDVNRNNGLIAISDNGISNIQNYSEGDLNIYLEEELVQNLCLMYYANIEQFNEYQGVNLDIEDIPLLDIDFDNIKFEEIGFVLEEIKNLNAYTFKNNFGEIICFIA